MHSLEVSAVERGKRHRNISAHCLRHWYMAVTGNLPPDGAVEKAKTGVSFGCAGWKPDFFVLALAEPDKLTVDAVVPSFSTRIGTRAYRLREAGARFF